MVVKVKTIALLIYYSIVFFGPSSSNTDICTTSTSLIREVATGGFM